MPLMAEAEFSVDSIPQSPANSLAAVNEAGESQNIGPWASPLWLPVLSIAIFGSPPLGLHEEPEPTGDLGSLHHPAPSFCFQGGSTDRGPSPLPAHTPPSPLPPWVVTPGVE